MKVLLSLYLASSVVDVPFRSTSEVLLGKIYPAIQLFSIDNHSSAEMAEHAIKLLGQAEVALVVAEVHQAEANAARLQKLMNYLVRNKSGRYHFALLGEHSLLRKMAKPLGERFYPLSSAEELLPLAERLFS